MLDKLSRFLFSYSYAFYFFAVGAFLCAIALMIKLCTLPFDRNLRILTSFSRACHFHFLKVNPFWKYEVEGLENIPQEGPCVFVSNHQSLFDIFALAGIGQNFKWVSKESMFKWPVVGWSLMLNEDISLVRGDRHSILQMLRQARHWIERGVSIMIFPEGTRSEDGNVHAFRYGAFNLSVESNVPLVPIVLDGTRRIMPKGGYWLKADTTVKVKVLPALLPEQFQGSSDAMCAYTENLIRTSLEDMRRISQGGAPDMVPA